MNKHLVLLLPFVALLVTGCPHNEYEVTLTPHGDKITRELVFYRDDSQNGDVSPDEIAAITALYPDHRVRWEDKRRIAKGEFVSEMPSDVGGAGTYSNLTTTMGYAAFYGERFRGDDDLAGQAEKRIAKANELVDVLIGWSRAELRSEPNYAQLRAFLDGDFRRDVKNAGFYWKQACAGGLTNTNTMEEFSVRFTQYLLERKYFKVSEVPNLFVAMSENSDSDLMGFIQRLVARKLGAADSQPVPPSLAFLRNSDAMAASFEKYFIGTDLYRNKAKEWKKNHPQDAAKPEVREIMEDEFGTLMEFNLFADTPDHLTVTLSLPGSPAHTNGKWDENDKAVVWESDLEDRTNGTRLPVFCYASWAQPAEKFQIRHFGRVIIEADDLVEYCLWRADLTDKHAAEWEKLLADLNSREDVLQKIKAFRFSDEKPFSDPNAQNDSPSSFGRTLIENALGGNPK
jgi:hypothetical protein